MQTTYGGSYPFRPSSDPTSVGRVGTEITEQQVRAFEGNFQIQWEQIQGVLGLVLLADADDHVILYSGAPEDTFADSQDSLRVGGVSYPIETVSVTF